MVSCLGGAGSLTVPGCHIWWRMQATRPSYRPLWEGTPTSSNPKPDHDAAGDDAARDDTAIDDAAMDDAARDDTARDDAARDNAARDDAAGDEAAGDEARRQQKQTAACVATWPGPIKEMQST